MHTDDDNDAQDTIQAPKPTRMHAYKPLSRFCSLEPDVGPRCHAEVRGASSESATRQKKCHPRLTPRVQQTPTELAVALRIFYPFFISFPPPSKKKRKAFIDATARGVGEDWSEDGGVWKRRCGPGGELVHAGERISTLSILLYICCPSRIGRSTRVARTVCAQEEA